MKTTIAFLTILFTSVILSNDANGKPAKSYPIAQMNEYFFAHDKDFNGILSNAEMSTLPKKVKASILKNLDKNGDGQVSLGEVLMKYKIDKNDDGYISKAELKAAVGAKTQKEMFKNIDMNGDGKFDLNEMKQAVIKASKYINAEAQNDEDQDEVEDTEEDEVEDTEEDDWDN